MRGLQVSKLHISKACWLKLVLYWPLSLDDGPLRVIRAHFYKQISKNVDYSFHLKKKQILNCSIGKETLLLYLIVVNRARNIQMIKNKEKQFLQRVDIETF